MNAEQVAHDEGDGICSDLDAVPCRVRVATAGLVHEEIVARARRRYEQAERRVAIESGDTDALDLHEARQPSVEDQALERIAWRDLANVVENRAVSPEGWATLVRIRFQLAPGQADARERQIASQASRRMSEWLNVAA